MMTAKRRRWNAGIAAGVVLAVAAAITVFVVTRGGTGRSTTGPCPCYGPPGWVRCSIDPDNCDAGDRVAGGAIVMAVGKSPRGWNPGSVRGSVGDTAEELAPLLPSAYVFLPS